MEIFQTFTGRRLSKMTNVKIESSDGEIIGRLIDAVVLPLEDGAKITKFVIGGSPIEELLESLKIRKDIDPVFTIEVVGKVTPNKIVLNVPKKDLKSTHIHQDALDENEIRLSELKKIKVFDNSNNQIGRLIDVKFEDDKFQFILGDSKITEWAESIGLVTDIDFLVSPKYITSFNKDGIILSKEKDELKSTFTKSYEEWKSKTETESRVAKDQIRNHSVYFPNRF